MNGLEGTTQVTFDRQCGSFPAGGIAHIKTQKAAVLTASGGAHMTTEAELKAFSRKKDRTGPVEGDTMPLLVQGWVGHRPGDRLRLPRVDALRHIEAGRAILDPDPPSWQRPRESAVIRAERAEHAAASGRGKKAARAEADKAKGRRGRRGVNAEAEVEETK